MRLGGCLVALGVGQSAMALEAQPNATGEVAPATPGLETPHDPAASGLALCPQTVEFADSCTVSFDATLPTVSAVTPSETLAPEPEAVSPTLDLDPAVIEGSPTLQRWLEDVPDVADEIRHRPSFRTRLRVGYAQFPSTGQVGGFGAAVEDVFVPGTGLAASVDYSRSWNGQRESYGGEARYYLLPLGGYFNIAPTVGYRSLSTPAYQTDGLDVGLRVMLVPSRGGGADLALSQRWVAPGSESEVGITSLAIGYAVTRQLRLGTDFQRQNSRFGQDSRVGVSLELLL
ncbi:MAG: hypothetical protein KME47_14115 [Nodosilinea sp. WJT8-NPBG4]|nr:hypothetical protein [Nodosilinea sp. WJT8-NPBG4]